MAQQYTRPDLHAAIEQRFPDNTNEEITPERLRDGLHELVDSAFLPASDKLPAAQVTAQLLGLDPATGEFLVLLSPSAPTTLNRYTLATYPAGILTTSALPVGTSIASRLLRLPASVLNQTLCLLDTASQPVPLMVLELKANEDGRFDLLTPSDRALPQSALRGLIDWHYEESAPTLPWTLKPGRSVMFTRSRQLVLNSDVQEGDVFNIYINPLSPVSRIELAYFGGIDEQPTKRYLPGTSLVLRYTYIPDYNDLSGNLIQAHYGLRTVQQTTLTATNFRGTYSGAAYYVAGDFVEYQGKLYLRLAEGGGNGATFDPTKWVGGGATSGLLTTGREDVFVDPTYAIPTSYLNTALTIRTYAQASVAVTLPALTSADVPALLRIEHQSGQGGTTCLLSVPGVARPLRVGEYVLLAATATPAIPPNPASGYPGAPAGTAWVVLTVSPQLFNPLSYPVMVSTSTGYVGYPTLAAANATSPQNIFLNQDVVLTQNITLSANVFGRGRTIRVSDGVTLKLFAYRTFKECRFELDGPAQTGKLATFGTSGQSGAKLRADECTQLVDCVVEVPIVMSYLDTQGITARGKTAIDNISGPGQLFLCDVCPDPATVGAGVLRTNMRPGAASGGGTGGGTGGGGGIDYANPVAVTGASTIITASTLYVLSGADFTVMLPASPAAGFRVRVKVAAGVAGLYTIDGNGAQIGGVASRALWADEGLELVYSAGAWLVLSDEARKALIRCESTPSNTVALPNGGGTVPLTTAVVNSTPFSFSAPYVTCRRVGVVEIKLSVLLQDTSPTGFYQLAISRTRNGVVTGVVNALVPVQTIGGSIYAMVAISGIIDVEPGDLLAGGIYANGGGYYRYDAPQPATFTVSEK